MEANPPPRVGLPFSYFPHILTLVASLVPGRGVTVPCLRKSLAILIFASALTGCSSPAPIYVTNTVSVTGNWQINSSATTAAKLPALSGELSGTGAVHGEEVAG